MLKFQLYGQASDLRAELTREELKSDNGVNLIVNAAYQRDALSVISEAFDGFNTLLTTRRRQSGSLKTFETRFSAAVTKFNSLSNTTKLPQCITALMLLSNASIEQSQRVSVLAAVASSGQNFSEQSTNDEFLNAVTYKQLASMVKQCERSSSTLSSTTTSLSASAAGAVSRSQCGDRNRKGIGPHKPSFSALKRLPCHHCTKFGHWKDSHRADGSLVDGAQS